MTLPFNISLSLTGDYGALPASRPWAKDDHVLEIPFRYSVDLEALHGVKIGVFIHIYYVDLCEEILAALQEIPFAFDVLVSTESEAKAAVIREKLGAVAARSLVVKVFPARGRDIAPFIVGFRDEIEACDIVCRLHSKKSSYSDILRGWRHFLFAQLLGSGDIVASIVALLASGEAEFVFPDHFGPVVQSLNFGFNYPHMKRFFQAAGIAFRRDLLLEFPSGSMFWATSRALRPTLNLGLRFEDFPSNDSQEYQVDGTPAHAMERSFLYLAESVGTRWVKVSQEQHCEMRSRLIPVFGPEDFGVAVTRATRRLLDNGVSRNMSPRTTPEIPTTGIRGEASERPRFTLIAPTLRPEKVFGGISSALRLFEEIRSQLPDSVDVRIVSITDSVDHKSLETVPQYVRLDLGAHNTETPRAVVDASGTPVDQLPIRRREVLLATAWWTADFGFRMLKVQQALYGTHAPLYYLIQDHEPDFYGWSPRYALAQATYMRPEDTRAIINSEELFNYFSKHYALSAPVYLPYRTNERVRAALRPLPKERIILIYGRPATARNCFELLIDGLSLWQQTDPDAARRWRIVSAGEDIESWRTTSVDNFESVGKLTLDDYGGLLSRAAVGVSLMVSPHPSYPPLEMASAGVLTVTNNYECKNLSDRSSNFLVMESVTPELLAEKLVEAVARAEARIGLPATWSEIADLPCAGRAYSAKSVADGIAEFLRL